MQFRSKWLLSVGLALIVAAGIVLLWLQADSKSARSLWDNHGVTVLQFAVPPVLALLGWMTQQLISARSGRSTPKQLRQAHRALAGRGLEWWRGVPEPAWPGHVLRAGLRPLEVCWARPVTQLNPASEGPVHGSTSDIKGLADRFLAELPARLVISGPPGSGKSVLARLLMAELLKRCGPADPVPVFLPLWSWDPQTERLHDWMTRRIAETYPELREETVYGPTAVAALVDQGLVLPILDGLDALPRRCRDAVLDDGELMSQDRVILTCRGDELAETDGFMLIAPRPVPPREAIRFLGEVTMQPAQWRGVKAHLDSHVGCPVSEMLTDPRFIYLASMVYENGRRTPGPQARLRHDPCELTCDAGLSVADVKSQLLKKLVPALLPPGGEWADSFPWYPRHAAGWLRSLSQLDLRDPADRALPAGPSDPGSSDPSDPGSSRIAWWNLYRGVRWLSRSQAILRALAAGILSFVIITFIFSLDRGVFYSLMTAGNYAIMVFVGCAFLGREPARRPKPSVPRPSRGSALWWWLRASCARSWPVLSTAVLTFAGVGTLLGFRVALSPIARHVGTHAQVGRRVGLYDGLTNALVVIITFLIAGVPGSPRTQRSADFGGRRAGIARFGLAMLIGIPFGVLWGATAVLRHQHYPGTQHSQAIITGLITGVDFVLGAWLFYWSAPWFQPRAPATPRSAARADLAGALLRPFILGFTFAFAFGISAPFNFTSVDVAAWFVVGTALGTLGTEWPLYVIAIGWLALHRKELPLRLLRFLECCRARGLLRVVGQEYQIHDVTLLVPELGRGPAPARPHDAPPDSAQVAPAGVLPAE